MPQSVLLIISIIVCLLFGTCRKYYIGKFGGGVKQVNFFNGVVAVFTIATFLIWGGFGKVSWFTALFALAYGVMTALLARTSVNTEFLANLAPPKNTPRRGVFLVDARGLEPPTSTMSR